MQFRGVLARLTATRPSVPACIDKERNDHLLAFAQADTEERQRTFADVGLKVDVSAFKGDTSPSGASSRIADQTGYHRNPIRSAAKSDARACGPSDRHFQFQNDEVTRRSSG